MNIVIRVSLDNRTLSHKSVFVLTLLQSKSANFLSISILRCSRTSLKYTNFLIGLLVMRGKTRTARWSDHTQAVQNCGNETSVTAALLQNSFTVMRYRYPKRNIVILQPRTGNILKENTWLQFAHNNFVIE